MDALTLYTGDKQQTYDTNATAYVILQADIKMMAIQHNSSFSFMAAIWDAILNYLNSPRVTSCHQTDF